MLSVRIKIMGKCCMAGFVLSGALAMAASNSHAERTPAYENDGEVRILPIHENEGEVGIFPIEENLGEISILPLPEDEDVITVLPIDEVEEGDDYHILPVVEAGPDIEIPRLPVRDDELFSWSCRAVSPEMTIQLLVWSEPTWRGVQIRMQLQYFERMQEGLPLDNPLLSSGFTQSSVMRKVEMSEDETFRNFSGLHRGYQVSARMMKQAEPFNIPGLLSFQLDESTQFEHELICDEVLENR